MDQIPHTDPGLAVFGRQPVKRQVRHESECAMTDRVPHPEIRRSRKAFHVRELTQVVENA